MVTVTVEGYGFSEEYDDHADASWLEQDIEGFAERLQEYRDGAFHFIGIVATVSVECITETAAGEAPPVGFAWTFTGAGNGCRMWSADVTTSLWGIESDSSPDYINSVEQDLMGEIVDWLWEQGCVDRDALGAIRADIEQQPAYGSGMDAMVAQILDMDRRATAAAAD